MPKRIEFDIESASTVSKSFRMPEQLVEKLYKVAQCKNISMNRLVIQCCEFALKHLKGVDEILDD